MFILSQKLKTLKYALKTWNKEAFGDVQTMIDYAQANLNAIQQQIASAGYTDSLLDQELTAQQELDSTLAYQEEFQREKARINWFTQGDRNTSFFHKLTKVRHASKQLSVLKVGDSFIDNQADIEHHVLDYYTSLYASGNSSIETDFASIFIPNLASYEDNVMLTNLPSMEEVKLVLFGMNGAEAPRPNGFGGFSSKNIGTQLVGMSLTQCFSSFPVDGFSQT